MNDRTRQLKIKIKSLAEEARIIRSEERKAKKDRDHTLLNSLCNHRKHVVRPAARESLLAYGFLRGIPYHWMEARCAEGNRPRFSNIRRMAERFGPINWENLGWVKWRDAALKHLEKPEVPLHAPTPPCECLSESATPSR